MRRTSGARRSKPEALGKEGGRDEVRGVKEKDQKYQ